LGAAFLSLRRSPQRQTRSDCQNGGDFRGPEKGERFGVSGSGTVATVDRRGGDKAYQLLGTFGNRQICAGKQSWGRGKHQVLKTTRRYGNFKRKKKRLERENLTIVYSRRPKKRREQMNALKGQQL